jgi:hypothetical protein
MSEKKTTDDPQVALYAALVAAQAQARGVEKDANNNFHRYRYVSAEHMIGEAKEILTAHGLAVVPVASTVDGPIYVPPDGSADDWQKVSKSAATLDAKWAVLHRQGGRIEVETSWPVVPEKGRPIDKAVAAARTASLSYLLRDLLQIPRVEEGTDLDGDERDRHDNRSHQPPPRQQQQQARPAPETGPLSGAPAAAWVVQYGAQLDDAKTQERFYEIVDSPANMETMKRLDEKWAPVARELEERTWDRLDPSSARQTRAGGAVAEGVAYVDKQIAAKRSNGKQQAAAR